jgi:prepilin-type N-terminal cleavage/methylation domain-containing protein
MSFLRDNKKQGFTLIELMVVIAIISLLTSITLVALNSSRGKGRDAARRHNLQQVQLAIELYFSDNNAYPPNGSPNTGVNWSVLAPLLANYMPTGIPKDPSGDSFYIIQYITAAAPASSYGIQIKFEGTGTTCKTGVGLNPAWWVGVPLC